MEGKVEMTGTPAYYELDWAVFWRDSLIFRNEVHVGQLVFAFDNSVYKWMPYWVVDAENGKYEIVDAYGDKRIKDIRDFCELVKSTAK